MVSALAGIGASMIATHAVDRAIMDTQVESGFTLLADYIIKQTNEITTNANDKLNSQHKDDTALKEQHSFTGERFKDGAYFHNSTTPNIHILEWRVSYCTDL